MPDRDRCLELAEQMETPGPRLGVVHGYWRNVKHPPSADDLLIAAALRLYAEQPDAEP